MFFGLPWFAIVAIVAIVGGLLYDYKEKELKSEEKRMSNIREFRELQQVVHNLKSRVDSLENELKNQPRKPSSRSANPLGEIEIDDEVEEQNYDNSGRRKRNRN